MTFDDLPLFQQEDEPDSHQDKIERKWRELRRKDPSLLPRLAEIALEMKRSGLRKWSTKGLFEVYRWQTRLSMDDLGFKANNNYTALASRDLMREYPELEGYFKIKQRKPQGNWGQVS